MKEILDKESKKALVAYRIQRAYETLREAEVMIRESFYNAAINRLIMRKMLTDSLKLLKRRQEGRQ